jgi:hypothetical protein
MQFDKEGHIVSGSTPEKAPEFPTVQNPAIAEITSMEAALHSQMGIFRMTYPAANKHEIGSALHMIEALANDISVTAGLLHERYSAALAAEIEAEQEEQQNIAKGLRNPLQFE